MSDQYAENGGLVAFRLISHRAICVAYLSENMPPRVDRNAGAFAQRLM
jgi:hypothetical protein